MIARIYLGLGEIDRALEWLTRGVEERSYWNVFLKMDPVYDEIRKDSRFGDLLEEVGFSAGKRAYPGAVRQMSRAADPLRFLATG